ncbi:MAG: HAMP domain-containing protein [Anaerolineales bacterium]|nr:HAMP domain-containing protein [Chloroflexota bacterium]MBL6983110.1 HAMP domain-containing protein [Anaerolineales bacterium]
MSEGQETKKGLFLSIRWKMLILFTLLFTIVFAAAFYWFYTFSTQLALDNLYLNLLAAARTAAAGIDADLHQALYENPYYDESLEWPKGMHDERYWEIAEWLFLVHQSNPRALLYTYVSPEPGKVEFITSMGPLMDPIIGADYAAEYWPQPPSVILDGLEKETLSTNVVVDEWGAWVSGFIPIKDSNGEIIAALGVDYEADDIVELQNQIKFAAIPAFIITFVVLLVSVVMISNRIAAPIRSLSSVAERIGEGQYDLAKEVKARTRDEVSTLTDVFNLMVEKVRAREEKLKKQVAALQIIIDRTKQKEQVRAITDTDFFQELQEKANEMRERHKKK